MSIKSDLQLARKYEWNAMLAKNQNNIEGQQRYESMAKMAMLDAAISYEDSRNTYITPYHSYTLRHDSENFVKKHPVVTCFIICSTSLLMIGAYLIGNIL